MKNIPYIIVTPEMLDLSRNIIPNPCATIIKNLYFYVSQMDMNHIEIMNSVSMYTSSDLPNGIYTYIYYTKNNIQSFLFAQTRSIFEFGTKHTYLLNRSRATILHIAGEIVITTSSLYFNFYSGSYMSRLHINDNQSIISYMTHKLRNGKEIIYENRPFIRDEIEYPFNESDLFFMVVQGAKVYVFTNKQQCILNNIDSKLERYGIEMHKYIAIVNDIARRTTERANPRRGIFLSANQIPLLKNNYGYLLSEHDFTNYTLNENSIKLIFDTVGSDLTESQFPMYVYNEYKRTHPYFFE